MRTLKQDGMEKVLQGVTDMQASARGLHQVRRSIPRRACDLPAVRRRPARTTCGQRLEQLNDDRRRALARRRDIDRLLETILAAAKTITHADGGTLYRVHRRQDAALRDHAHRLAQVLRWAAPPASRFRSIRSSCYKDDGKPNHAHGRGVRRAHTARRSTSPTPTSSEGFDFSGTRELRPEDRLPLEVVPDRADEEPRARDHRRAAAHQCQGPRRPARSSPFSAADQQPRRVARLAGGDRAHQPAADQPAREAVRVVHQPDQHRDRRQVALHRRPLPARAGS